MFWVPSRWNTDTNTLIKQFQFKGVPFVVTSQGQRPSHEFLYKSHRSISNVPHCVFAWIHHLLWGYSRFICMCFIRYTRAKVTSLLKYFRIAFPWKWKHPIQKYMQFKGHRWSTTAASSLVKASIYFHCIHHLPQDGRMPYRDGNVNIPQVLCAFFEAEMRQELACILGPVPVPRRQAAGSRDSTGFLLPWPSLLLRASAWPMPQSPALISAPPTDDLNSGCSMNFWETQRTSTRMNYCWDNSAYLFSQLVMTAFKSSHSPGQGKPSRAFTLLNLLSRETGGCIQST